MGWKGSVTTVNQLATSIVPAGSSHQTVQSILDSVPSIGGRVYFEHGSYPTYNSPLLISQTGTILEGEGSGTRLTWDGDLVTGGFIKMADTTVRPYCQVKNLYLSSSVANKGLALNLDYFTLARIQNVVCDSINGGLDISNGNSFYNLIDNFRAIAGGANGFGMRLAKNEQTVIRTRISANDSNNVKGIIVNAAGVHLISPNVESGANLVDIGIDVQSAGHSCVIDDIYLENNNINLQLASGIRGFKVNGGEILDANNSVASNIVDNGAIKPEIYCRLGNTVAPVDNYGYKPYSTSQHFPTSRFQGTKGIQTTKSIRAIYWGVATSVEGAISSVTSTGTALAAEDATEGRYTRYASGAVANTPAGHRITAGISTRRQNIRFKTRSRFPISALTDYRIYLGLTSDLAAFPTTDDPIGTTRSAVILIKRAADTNWFIGHNDASGAAVYTDSGIAVPAINTWITVEIIADEANSRFLVSIDNSAYIIVNTDIPAAGTLLGLWCSTESVNATDTHIHIPYWEMEADR